ncbi:Solute carrier family 28 member 3 [Amphibalanus amphitrite]|uniref:Solute carrier family 28 member 3 n=1 Tax=Amphibalanus amphitrite TaxID=1232801 RepID=A0A6A4VAU8_AMPAM|nr:Solute carrier family 28 member 3 [Amphibalanus amphitrite]
MDKDKLKLSGRKRRASVGTERQHSPSIGRASVGAERQHTPSIGRASVGTERPRSPSFEGSTVIEAVTVRPPTPDRGDDGPPLDLPASDANATESSSNAQDKMRRNAVLGQTNTGPEPWTMLDYVKRRSIGMPNRINLDAERASIVSVYHGNARDKPELSSKTSVIDAILGTRWSLRQQGTDQDSPDENEEQQSQRCQPRSVLFYPHHAFGVILQQLKRHPRAVRLLIFVLWVAYVTYAVVYNFYIMKADYDWCHAGGLISWTSVVIFLYLVTSKVIIPYAHRIHSLQAELQNRALAFLKDLFSRRQVYVRIIAGALIAVIIVLVTRIGHMIPTTKQLTAVCGYCVIILVTYLLSVEPEEIRWPMVIKNLLLQLIVVYLMMVWALGRVVLECMASKIDFLFGFSKKAAWVLFSQKLPHMLSIELLSSLTLTGSIMHLLYYTGVLQGFLHKTGLVLELITGTTTVEAISGALCTLFGVALAMYMDMGVDRVTLMTVNFATFNGVLAVSKIMYPETDTSVTTYRDLKFMDRDEYNMIDAGVRGAIAVLRLLAQLVAVLIAFIALVNMGNDFIEWLLENVGIPGMDLVKRERAVTVALLYGFSNLAHVGATVAYLTALAPERRHDISSTVPRALLTAVLTNLLTAALVGALVFTHTHPTESGQGAFNATNPLGNATTPYNVSSQDFFKGMNGSIAMFHH